MRRLALLGFVVLATALAGCGGGGSSSTSGSASHTAVETAKAFSDAGIPFGTLVTSNPYVRGQQVYLPGKLNGSPIQDHVLAMLSGSGVLTRTGWVAWVFDSDANAQQAVKLLPLAKWGGNGKITRAIDGNVIAMALNFSGAQKPKLDAALKSLHG